MTLGKTPYLNSPLGLFKKSKNLELEELIKEYAEIIADLEGVISLIKLPLSALTVFLLLSVLFFFVFLPSFKAYLSLQFYFVGLLVSIPAHLLSIQRIYVTIVKRLEEIKNKEKD